VTDRIELRGIEVIARHGVLESEQIEPQLFRVDVTVHVDTTAAALTDDITETVDYGELAQQVHDLVARDSHRLIETVADRVARLALGVSGVERVEVTVHKPQAPIPLRFEDVSITIDRRR
jgi:dihydroneopterin aldolase